MLRCGTAGVPLLLPLLLSLLLLREVVSDDAACCGAEDGMMTRHVPGHATHGGALQAALRLDAARSSE